MNKKLMLFTALVPSQKQ